MTKDIEIFVPRLPIAPGWVGLNTSEREWLQEHTSNAVQSYRQSGFQALRCCVELASIEQFLKNKPMTMTNWLRTVFPGTERTGRRWLENYKQMRDAASDEALLYLAEHGVTGLNNVHAGNVAVALKRLPPPKSTDKKALQVWTEKVGDEIRKDFGRRQQGKALKLSPDDSVKVFILTGTRLLRESKLNSSAEQRSWLKKGVGMIMERRAITGTVAAERLPIPDGFLPKRGRPRKNPKEK